MPYALQSVSDGFTKTEFNCIEIKATLHISIEPDAGKNYFVDRELK